MSISPFKRDPQSVFNPETFTVTDTIFKPPLLMMAPAIYRDETRKKWAVRFKGAEPTIFDYADVVDCAIVEDDAGEKSANLSGKELFEKVLSNPGEVSRANAAKKGRCTGLGVIVAVRTSEGVTRLDIPVITGEMRRESPMFVRMVRFAQQILSTFDDMKSKA